MRLELGRALLLAEAISPDALAKALTASVRDRVCLVRALLFTEAIGVSRLEEELARTAPDAPLQHHPVPVPELVARLPPRLCESLLAIPVRADPRTGTVDVALADAADEHAADEIAFYLSAPVRVVRSPLGAIESAIDQARQHARSASSGPPSSGPISVPPPSPTRPVAKTPPWGSPVFTQNSEADIASMGPASISERPIPLVPRTGSEHTGAEIPILLSRRTNPPGAGLLALARAAKELEDEEEPVVELRRPRSAKPPAVSEQSSARSTPEPTAPAHPPEGERTITLPSAPLNQLLREMTRVAARDPLMELVLLALRPVAPKTALFAVKKDAYVGWMCTSEFGDRSQLAEVRIDARKATFLATTALAGTYVGPMLRSPAVGPLAKFITSPEREVVGAAIKAGGRPVVLVIAHEVGEPLEVMSALGEVTRAAGEALERILRARR